LNKPFISISEVKGGNHFLRKYTLPYYLDGGDEELYDPVALVYPLHTAPINCIAVSPIDGSIFATTAQDGVKDIKNYQA